VIDPDTLGRVVGYLVPDGYRCDVWQNPDGEFAIRVRRGEDSAETTLNHRLLRGYTYDKGGLVDLVRDAIDSLVTKLEPPPTRATVPALTRRFAEVDWS
jgi:hypothetical protein